MKMQARFPGVCAVCGHLVAVGDAIDFTPSTKAAGGRAETRCVSCFGKPVSAAAHAHTETRRCWECGCTFTRTDARRNGGDWADSYCGC